jgi:uncharacterized protein YjiS (DUF1127 family)
MTQKELSEYVEPLEDVMIREDEARRKKRKRFWSF